jgi:hypothetical protein
MPRPRKQIRLHLRKRADTGRATWIVRCPDCGDVPTGCVEAEIGRAREALAAHRSQQGWLEASQGNNSYLVAMDDHARAMGRRSGASEFSEGWWQHLHIGLAATDRDPLAEALGASYRLNPDFETSTRLIPSP